MDKFKICDVVRLKSDSSKTSLMTVEGYSKDKIQDIPVKVIMPLPNNFEKLVVCVWRDSYSKLHTQTFNEDMLVLCTQNGNT